MHSLRHGDAEASRSSTRQPAPVRSRREPARLETVAARAKQSSQAVGLRRSLCPHATARPRCYPDGGPASAGSSSSGVSKASIGSVCLGVIVANTNTVSVDDPGEDRPRLAPKSEVLTGVTVKPGNCSPCATVARRAPLPHTSAERVRLGARSRRGRVLRGSLRAARDGGRGRPGGRAVRRLRRRGRPTTGRDRGLQFTGGGGRGAGPMAGANPAAPGAGGRGGGALGLRVLVA